MTPGKIKPSWLSINTAPITPPAKMARLNDTVSRAFATSPFAPLASPLAVWSCVAAPPKAMPQSAMSTATSD